LYLPASTPNREQVAAQAQQWGMVVTELPPTDAESSQRGFVFDAAQDGDIDAVHSNDGMSLRSMNGKQAIDHAREHMPVVRNLIDALASRGALKGVRFAISIVLEPKTAVFLEELAAAGAVVGIYCDGESTDPRVIDELEKLGIVVSADIAWSPQRRKQEALRLLDTIQPDIVIDDGASFARLLIAERPAMAKKLIGVSEETTSGIRAFAAIDADDALPFPVIAVNDSVLKTGFDNAHGTGETCVTTILEHLGAQAFEGSRVCVIGYGPVGKGFALRARALGALVTVADTDPVACLRAVFDGLQTAEVSDVVAEQDMVISATGVRHTVSVAHMQGMKQGAVLGVIGGIANELALDEIGFQRSGTPVSSLTVPGGPTITLLADGDGVNYTVGNGNPIDIMDLSFAVQTMAVAHLLRNKNVLPHHLLHLDRGSDEHIAAIALRARGSRETQSQSSTYDWHLSRFEDELATQQPPSEPANANDSRGKNEGEK
jgi:adenosylhomocysteinase